MRRRDFLKSIGLYGLVGLSTQSGLSIPNIFQPTDIMSGANGQFALSITEAMVEMINLERVYMWTFADEQHGPRFPGPVIMAQEGQSMQVTITNTLREDHAFSIPDVVDSGPIAAGQTKEVSFTAPAPGTYLYMDPLNAPINRVLGLHGAMMVMPGASGNPYGNSATQNVQALFNDLGRSREFPGEPWMPGRTIFWIMHEIDPSMNMKIMNGEQLDPNAFAKGFLPRYFTLTGKTGLHATWDPDIAPHGTVGQPYLIRMMATGLMTHSLHTHMNHHYVLARNGEVQENVIVQDTTTVDPMDTVDLLIPMQLPPDIPPSSWPPKEEGFPMLAIVHDHIETGQSADGGNYPHGITTHLVFTGPLLQNVSEDQV